MSDEEDEEDECEVCGVAFGPCIVSAHEKTARDNERRALATWLRSSEALAIVYDAVMSSTESVVEACGELAKVVERKST